MDKGIKGTLSNGGRHCGPLTVCRERDKRKRLKTQVVRRGTTTLHISSPGGMSAMRGKGRYR